MLRVEHVNAGYGDIQVLWDVSFHVARNEFVVLVGANGAGKSTIMRTISSIVSVNSGEIWFEDQRLDKVEPYKIGRSLCYVLVLVFLPGGLKTLTKV